MKKWEDLKPLSLEELRAELDRGIADADAGQCVEVDFDALNAELDKIAEEKAAHDRSHG